MKLHVINTGYFKLDGGAMFGVVPRVIWERTNPADENNLCTWAMRCLLVEVGDRLMLIDTGIGEKQSEKFFSHYYLHGTDSLVSSIHKSGFKEEDITDVFLTHLHFDHVGGAVYLDDNGTAKLRFPNAKYWSNKKHWEWAINPNPREKASFLKENLLPIQESGQLHFIEKATDLGIPAIDLIFVDGHTEQQMLPVITYKGQKLVFVADLLPSAGHIPLPYVMSYDTRPLLTMKEKAAFLEEAVAKEYILFFEHDPENECGKLVKTEKGVRIGETFPLEKAF